jgi:hypothetical protein
VNICLSGRGNRACEILAGFTVTMAAQQNFFYHFFFATCSPICGFSTVTSETVSVPSAVRLTWKVKNSACQFDHWSCFDSKLHVITSTFGDKMEDVSGFWRQLHNYSFKICSDPSQQLLEL